jgi:hypothetical protein
MSGADTQQRAVLLTLALLGVVGLSLLASGCGDSTRAAVVHIGSTPTATSSSGNSGSRDDTKILMAYGTCMRKHGVPNFPDPKATASGYHLVMGSESGIDPHSSQFKNAQQACKTLLPGGGKPSSQDQAKELREALTYSACMRAHGLPNFPDPKASGDGGIGIGVGAKNVNPGSPQFKAAEHACHQLLPGVGDGISSSGSAKAP